MASHGLRSPVPSRRSLWSVWPWAGLCFGLACTVLAWLLIRKTEAARLHDLRRAQALEMVDRVDRRLKELQGVLLGAAGFLGHGPLPDRAAWQAYAERLHVSDIFPGTLSLGYAAWIPSSGLAAHVRRLRKEGFPDYDVAPGGTLAPLPEGISSIIYLEPMNARNQRAFGKDMLADAVRREAMLRARDTGAVTLSGKVQLFQETETDIQAGAVLFAPVYRYGLPLGSQLERRAAFLGWTTVPLRMGDFIQATLSKELRTGDFALYDGLGKEPGTLLFDSDSEHPASGKEAFSQQSFEASGRTWTAFVHPNSIFYADAGRTDHVGLLLGGIAASLCLFLLLWTKQRAEQRALDLADQRGAELQGTEAQFRALFEMAPFGMAIVDTGTGRLLSVNQRLGDILGYEGSELLARGFQDLTHPDDLGTDLSALRDLAAGLIAEIRREKRYLHKDGHAIWGRVSVVMLPSTPDKEARHLAIVEDITEARRRGEDLKAFQARFQAIFDLSPDPITLSRLSDESLAMVNPAWCELTGVPAEDAIGQSHRTLGLWSHPADWEGMLSELRGEGRFTTKAALLRCRDGSERQLLISARLMNHLGEDLVLTMGKDVTAWREAEARLGESESRFRTLAETAPVLIWMTDATGRCVHFNQAWTAWTGLPIERALGEGWFECILAEDRELCRASFIRAFEAREPFATEFRLRHSSGAYRWISDRGTPRFAADGAFLGYIGAGIDIQDMREAEAAVRESELRVHKAESLVLMAGGIAHDFNNLFQSILGYLEIATLKVGEDADIVPILNKAEYSLRKAIGLSWKMLDFSGRSFIKVERMDLEGWLPAYLATLALELPPGFHLDLSCSPVPGILGDSAKLEEILKALVDNAQEAAGPAGGRVSVRLYTDFGADRADSETGAGAFGVWRLPPPEGPATVCLEVADAGPGVSLDQLSLIGDPFYTTKELGRGLGLAATVGILSAHRAGLHLMSGKGGLNGKDRGLVLRMHFPPG